MNKLFFYPKLAASNIKKNGKIYLPYLFTCIGTVMMFYILCALTTNSHIKELPGGAVVEVVLLYGTIVVGLFALIFLLYSNSFLIKRRKKELGLYNILGMEKKHISKIMVYESLYVTVISILTGLGLGILFSKLVFLGLLKLLKFNVVFGFEVPASALISTVAVFFVIFCLTLLNNLRQIHLVNPIELLKGGEVGEREPKAKWLAALIGLLCLAGGYTISVVVKDPLSAIFTFFIAVILVVIGTYLLFHAGSIALLKLLRKNKKFFYKTNHFISVSGMIYRMKQNAAGLANICILATMVLVMVSSTVSLYAGKEDILQTRYPKEIMISSTQTAPDMLERIEGIADPVLASYQAKAENTAAYRYLSITSLQSGASFKLNSDEASQTEKDGGLKSLYFIPFSDFQKSYPAYKDVTLHNENDALLLYNRSEYDHSTLEFLDHTFHVQVFDESIVLDGFDSAQVTSTYYVVVKDMSVIASLDAGLKATLEGNAPAVKTFYGFDVNTEEPAVLEGIYTDIRNQVSAVDDTGNVSSRQAEELGFYSLFGGFFFLGLFLGLLFIMATVLIIYYKQISEGYDDKNRFEIMQKVGMSHREVKKSIHSQVITVFFLPLLTAGIHTAFAFGVVSKILAAFMMKNTLLFFLCVLGSFLIFALFYVLIYAVTAKVYYKIVS